MKQEPDTEPGNYYVSMIDEARSRVALLAGPFVNDHAGALAAVSTVTNAANEVDPWSHFYAFGTCRKPAGYVRPGILNSRVGLPS